MILNFSASFALLCPDGYGYVKEMIGELMEGKLYEQLS